MDEQDINTLPDRMTERDPTSNNFPLCPHLEQLFLEKTFDARPFIRMTTMLQSRCVWHETSPGHLSDLTVYYEKKDDTSEILRGLLRLIASPWQLRVTDVRWRGEYEIRRQLWRRYSWR